MMERSTPEILLSMVNQPVQLYRWADDSQSTLPTVAFSGIPAQAIRSDMETRLLSAVPAQITQILLGSRNGSILSS